MFFILFVVIIIVLILGMDEDRELINGIRHALRGIFRAM